MLHLRSPKLPISLLILTKNEELCLDFSLPSLKHVVKEIIIYDTGSSDRTIKVAKTHGAKVIEGPIDKKNRSNTRNRLIECATQPWILMFDGDFLIAKKDLPKLVSIINNPKADAYRLPIRYYSNNIPLFFDWKPCRNEYPREEKFSKYFGYYDAKKIVLFRNRPEIRCRGRIYDIVDASISENGFRMIESDIVVHHYELLKGMRHHMKKHAYYFNCTKKDVKEWPHDKIGYLNLLSDLILTNQNHPEANQWALELIKLDPYDNRSWWLRALIEMGNHRLGLAEKYLIKSVAIQPNFSNLCLLGWLYLRKNDFGKSQLFLIKALKKQPKHPLAINLLGILKERSGRYREALILFKKASRIHPGYADAVFNQAVIYEKIGRSKESRILHKKAKQLTVI